MHTKYYVPSGKAPVQGIFNLLITGAGAAIGLSILYVALQWFIPFIYLNFFITLGLGFGVYWMLSFMQRTAKVRNAAIAGGIGLFAGLVALYSQWALYVSLMEQVDGTVLYFAKTSFNLDNYIAVFTSPFRMFAEIGLLNEIGTFSIKSAVVSGIVLWIVWAIEAVMIVALPAFLLYVHAKNPYSEVNDTWMDETKWDLHLKYIEDTDAFKQAVENGNYDAIKNLTGNDDETKFSTITGYNSPGDENMYITIKNHLITYDKKGEKTEDDTVVVEHLRTTHDALGQIISPN